MMTDGKLKIIRLTIIGLVLTGLTWGAYALFAKVFRDRARVANFDRPPRQTMRQNQPQRTQQNYTPEEMQKLRKEGKLPQAMNNPPAPIQPNMAGQDAVQRSLRTVDEINRLNQMNQQLMEQQRRMQNVR